MTSARAIMAVKPLHWVLMMTIMAAILVDAVITGQEHTEEFEFQPVEIEHARRKIEPGTQLAHFTIMFGYCVSVYCVVVGIVRLFIREVDWKNTQALQRAAIVSAVTELAKWMLDHRKDFAWFTDVCFGVLATVLLLLGMECYNKLVVGATPQPADMKGKVVVVTGANTGIGYETAKSLMSMGAHVIFACRNEEKALSAIEQARTELLNEKAMATRSKVEPTLDGKGTFMQVDLANLASVRKFCATLNDKQHSGLDVLVLNAGLMLSKRQATDDGFEMTFGVNYLAHFLMTNLLLDKLNKSSDPRVVVVTSSVMAKSLDFDDLQTENKYSLFKAYSKSKLANLMFGLELQRRVDKENEKKRKGKDGGNSSKRRVKGGVLVNMAHPGIPMTDISRGFSKPIVLAYDALRPLCHLFQKLPSHGAYTPVHLATSADIRAVEVGGIYFQNCYPELYPEFANDEDACSKLWEKSVELVGGLSADSKKTK